MNSQQGIAAAAPVSPMEKALNGVHNELNTLEDLAKMLEQKLVSVLEHSPTQGNTKEGVPALPPMPTSVIGVLGVAESRITTVRAQLSNLLDRLHV